ncbi:hypothetical protein HYW74_01980 [Candidatus Pacearchaeota archaeon]|nr:hypothetical protein [Candidatus Pacearchaeota archaeon]
MKLTKEFAEIIGMFAADGCLQEEYICMWGNINEDKEYYNKIVCPLFSKVFGKQVIAHEKKSNSVYGFYICDKKIVSIFKNLGFSKNKTYNVKIPNIIKESDNKKIMAGFIRGFTDCDGCLTFMKRKEKGYSKFKRTFNAYPRILINVVSKNIIEDISDLLTKLEIDHSRHIYKNKRLGWGDHHVITVRGIIGLEKWKEKIGFNSPAKLTKYFIWKKYGFCPTNISLSQRKLILNNKLDPNSFYSLL